MSENELHFPNSSYEGISKFTTVLRMTSGQDAEPDLILVEHSYARPWNWQQESSNSRPCKTLFLSKIPKSESDEIIDVVKDSSASSSIPPYDLVRGKHLMSECERHVVFAKLSRVGGSGGKDDETEEKDEDTDWEEQVIKTGWTESQHNLFNRIVKILDSDRLAKLTLKDTVNEPIRRRAQIDKTAAKFRQSLGRVNWDLKLTQWLHNILLQNLSIPYLAAYLDILQTLKSKIPNLVDKMISLSSTHKGPNVEALNLLLKRPWDPAVPLLNEQKPCKLENLPIVIQVPSGTTSPNVPQASRRIRFFNSQLQHLAKSVPVSVMSETNDPGAILEQIMCEVQIRIAECKAQYPSHPIVLLGWGIGAILACYVSLVEKVSANVCLGFPMEDHKGKRGGTDDPLLGMSTPTLFMIGEKAINATVEDLENFRSRMRAETSLVVISGADLLLRMSIEKRYWDGLTQSMVDRCVVEEIGDFLTRTFAEDNNTKTHSRSLLSYHPSENHSRYTSSALSSATSTKVAKKDVTQQRKRKMSPMSLQESSVHQLPSKMMRTGTAISHTLGLKIPVGVSSVASLMKQDSKTFSAIHLGNDSEELSSTDGENLDKKEKLRNLMKGSDAASQRYKLPLSSKQADGASSSKQRPFASCSAPDVESPSVLSLSGGSLPTVASIPLGSLASLTRQRYQQMIHSSDSLDASHGFQYNRSNSSSFDWRVYNSKIVDNASPNSDVDICGLSSVASSAAGASVPHSSRDFGSESGFARSDGVPQYHSEPDSQTSRSMGGVDSSSAAHILVTSSLVSSTTTATPKPLGGRRGRPPGRPKGSYSRGRGRGQSTSMAVLTLTGAAGDGSGVESAGRGISSLGRGVLTLSKGGTSTVRVYSASGQKLPSSNVSSLASGSTQIGTQKSRGFYLTNITAANTRNNVSGNAATSTLSGRVIASNKIITNAEDARKSNNANAATLASSSGQVSLNLQGISASRAVSFGNSRPAAVMLLPSTVASTSTSSIATTAATTTTTTTISSGGLKTTKSIIGLRSSLEGLKLPYKETNLTLIQEEEKVLNLEKETSMEDVHPGEEKLLLNVDGGLGNNSSSGSSLPVAKETSGVTSQKVSDIIKAKETSNVTDNSKSILVTKPQKTLVLGTKVVSSTSKCPAMKSNITFISSKTLNKVFASSESLQPLSMNNPTCTSITVPAKASSIRLVRSIGAPSGALRVSSSTSAGNIITKTFTISSNPLKRESFSTKRRISLDSRIKNVTKRSRGTSTDHIVDNPPNTDVLSADSNPDKMGLTTQESKSILDESGISKTTQTSDNQDHPNGSEESTMKSIIDDNAPVIKDLEPTFSTSKDICLPATQSIVQEKESLSTTIKVTKELLTSSLSKKDTKSFSSPTIIDNEPLRTKPDHQIEDQPKATPTEETVCKESITDYASIIDATATTGTPENKVSPNDSLTPLIAEPVVLITSSAKDKEEPSTSNTDSRRLLKAAKHFTSSATSKSGNVISLTKHTSSLKPAIDRNLLSKNIPKVESKDENFTLQKLKKDSVIHLKSTSSKSDLANPENSSKKSKQAEESPTNRVTRSTIKTVSKTQRRLRSSF